ncbi:RNA polymerase subunit sigma-70 [Bordetella genomosp. 10]|uniref:RNA polymerase subunit sigma-70 n=1 Tax=Bordetella genomosp. 10 TaxID=1416804 RepID=A0A261S060_9BORD|nr:sigma-70 family RNA polymerase sigma factor [Bordetella genomosp. 10]OZI30736.1 RNA polymerase subunit sigma-70 [Bordetella genomosp. 10]
MSRHRPPESGWLAHYRELLGTWVKGNSRRHDAEDAAQESIIGVMAQDHAAALNPRAYLYRAANNRLVSEIRRQSRHETVSLEALADHDHPLLANPDADLRASELLRALEQALEQLPLKKRQAYILHRLEGYTQPEIAARMGLALNTVERYIMDATREIREKLQMFCPP